MHRTNDAVANAVDELLELDATRCALRHETVSSIDEDGRAVRVGFCARTTRNARLGCAHGMGRYRLHDALRSIETDELRREWAEHRREELNVIEARILALDWEKSELDAERARCASDTEALLAARIAAIVAAHGDCIDELAALRDRIVEELRTIMPTEPAPEPALHRRAVTSGDEEFLQELFAIVTTEQLQLDAHGFDDVQKRAIIAHQYNAYSTFYRTTYADAQDSIIEVDGEPAGRLIIIDLPGEVRLSDIMIHPRFRRRGICTSIMREEVARGRAAGSAITLHCEQTNPALALYRREGFEVRGASATHYVMEWRGTEESREESSVE